MQKLLFASFAVIGQKIPDRNFLRQTTLADALVAYAFSVFVAAAASIFPFPALPEGETPIPLPYMMLLIIATTVVAVLINRFMLNRYAKSKFSLKEVFVLETILWTGAGLIFNGTGIVAYFFANSFEVSFMTISAIFSIYMLYVMMCTISKIASISRSQAVLVMFAPLLIIFGIYLLFIFSMLVLASA